MYKSAGIVCIPFWYNFISIFQRRDLSKLLNLSHVEQKETRSQTSSAWMMYMYTLAFQHNNIMSLPHG